METDPILMYTCKFTETIKIVRNGIEIATYNYFSQPNMAEKNAHLWKYACVKCWFDYLQLFRWHVWCKIKTSVHRNILMSQFGGGNVDGNAFNIISIVCFIRSFKKKKNALNSSFHVFHDQQIEIMKGKQHLTGVSMWNIFNGLDGTRLDWIWVFSVASCRLEAVEIEVQPELHFRVESNAINIQLRSSPNETPK